MAKTIKSPIDNYTGSAQFAEVALDFKEGAATAESLSKPLEAYLKRRGYEVKGSNARAAKDDDDAEAKAKADAEAKAKGNDGGDVL
jgi:hypothetical protein